VRYEHPSIASLLIGVAQEADPISPGFEQSTAISNHSTLDFTLHYGEHWIILPGNASCKRLCSSSMPPDDDDYRFTDYIHLNYIICENPVMSNKTPAFFSSIHPKQFSQFLLETVNSLQKAPFHLISYTHATSKMAKSINYCSIFTGKCVYIPRSDPK